MKNLLMDFTIEKQTNTIKVRREFDAPIEKVWAYWTEKDLQDQWWAPKPWKAKTKSQDFRVGGRQLYAMLGPKGEEQWALADYTSITYPSNFKFTDAFSDKDGNIDQTKPRSKWDVNFTQSGDSTIVSIEIKHDKPEDLDAYLKMGFKEGFTMALENLDEILAKVSV